MAGRLRRQPDLTSNDLLFKLHGPYTPKPLHYEIIVQTADEVQDVENAPAISMSNYLTTSGQAWLTNAVSIYAQRGESPEQIRLLYFNPVALRIWQAMGKYPKTVGALHRPPKVALLSFGVPFSE
jgi:hypothetical protein